MEGSIVVRVIFCALSAVAGGATITAFCLQPNVRVIA